MATYYNVEDIKDILGVQKTKAYEIIRTLNEELVKKGYITISGKVSQKYFRERFYDDVM